MKGQVKAPRYLGEERLHSDGDNWLEKIFKNTPKSPNIINIDSIKRATEAVRKEAFGQLTGFELSAGKAVSLMDEDTKEAPRKETSTPTVEHLNYVSDFLRKAESREQDTDQIGLARKIEEIQMQLKQMKESSDVLEGEFKDVVIDTVPENPGIYHLTFFEGFLKLILRVKDKIDDVTIFAKLFKSRKQERSYHSMAKKRGTSFTLHHDRVAATQTG